MASLSPDSSMVASHNGDGSSSSLKSNKLKFVIAIDYGTTCTGVAYGYRFSGEPIIQTVRAWPGDDELIKVPSDIAYLIPRDNDKQRRFRWGTSVPGQRSLASKRDFEDYVTLKWVKLTLEDPRPEEFGKDLPSEIARKRMAEVPFGPFRPVDVISDYLTELWEHVLRQIHRDLINLLSSEIQANMEKIVILTVPASWSIHATRSMYNAAMKANLDRNFQMHTELEAAPMKSTLVENFRLHIITEPEAAAMHILTSDFLKVGLLAFPRPRCLSSRLALLFAIRLICNGVGK
ncbi:MAG: hypothetical protein M1839_005282 [Geoglossum umbratile]|nr:MAG: hypothetical protein M1839_005282 [Geoglossum umbratile]